MSNLSIRQYAKTALADGIVDLAEAETMSFIAHRTNGVDAKEQKELRKVLGANVQFAAGAEAHLAATAADAPTCETPVGYALKQLVNAHGLDILSLGKDAKQNKFGASLKAGIEEFAKVTGNSDGDTLACSALELRAGAQKVYVVTDCESGQSPRDLVAFFDGRGRELGRAEIRVGDNTMSMSWLDAAGAAGAPIGSPTAHGKDEVPAGFAATVAAFADKKDETGDDYGARIEREDLPACLARRYAFMERTIADGTAAEKAEIDGVTVFVLRDFSCVASAYFYTENGTLLHTVCG